MPPTYVAIQVHELTNEELIEDICHSAFEMGVAKVGLSVELPDDTEHKIQTRYDHNEIMVGVIKKELLRRLRNDR